MLLTSLFAQARALCRARGKSGRAGRADRNRPHARRACFERLEVREVLSGGVVVTAVGAGAWAHASASFLDSSGNIVVAGSGVALAGGVYNDFAALRFQPNGQLDPTFGNRGTVVTPLCANQDHAVAAAMYPAIGTEPEKIVLAGDAMASYYKYRGWTYPNVDFALARYTNGILDTTFGDQGTVITDVGGGPSTYAGGRIGGVVVLPDGRIVAAGGTELIENSQWEYRFALACYRSTGELDATFGAGGVVTTSFEGGAGAHAVTLHQDKILAVGTGHYDGNGNHDFVLARYNLDGSLDTTFGQDLDADGVRDGKVITDFGWDDDAVAVAIDADESIVVLGNTATNLCKFGLARYLPDGTLDTNFGTDGLARYHFGIPGDGPVPYALAIEPGTRNIIAVGVASISDIGGTSVVARFKPNGSLDSTFGSQGLVITPVLKYSTGKSIALQSDGKIVVSGDAYADVANDVFVARYNSDGSLDENFVGDTPSLAINDVSKAEGNSGTTAFTFTVTRSGNLVDEVSANYATANGTATAGSDYTATSGTLSFAPGEVTKTITVLVNGDKLKEANETFYVNLSGAVGASIADGTGIGTIRNDDGKTTGGSLSAAAVTDAALADTGRQQLALAALLQYEDQLQANKPEEKKSAAIPAIDVALLDLAI